MSREIQQSNKAPRHHNDNFESDKRFIETVAELRLMNLKQTGCVLDDLATQIKQSLEKVYQDFDASDNEKSIYNDWDKESVSLCKLKEMKRKLDNTYYCTFWS